MNHILKNQKIKDYLLLMRFHQPTGIYLLLLPCLWSLAIIDLNILNFKLLAIFIIGSIITRALGCVINDLVDINIDKDVLRTSNRPLTSGRIKISEAVYLIIILSFIALAIALSLNRPSLYISLIAPLLITIYPFMKRVTYFPQLFLGITFNLGVLIASTACTGKIEFPNLLLYISVICWSLGYDTIYAHQDKYYDEKLGLKSTALFLTKYQKFLISFYYILMLLFLILAGKYAGLNSTFYIAITPLALWFIYKIIRLNLNIAEECANIFKLNRLYGLLILLSILLSNPLLVNSLYDINY